MARSRVELRLSLWSALSTGSASLWRLFQLVGPGRTSQRAGIKVVRPRAKPPSGGFAYLSLKHALIDELAGGARLVARQLRFLLRYRPTWDAVVGVGDRVSLHLNHRILKKS